MATVTHYIRSDYDPAVDRERLQRETGQLPEEAQDEADLAWQTEPTFGVRRRLAASAPHFVPATIPFDEWGGVLTNPNAPTPLGRTRSQEDVAAWYRSLHRRELDLSPGPSSLPTVQKAASAPPPELGPSTLRPPGQLRKPKRDRQWFISRALSQPSSTPSTHAPATSLADILARNPPSERPLKPPVFLHLDPSNRGWAMLQSRGWSEGEGLGMSVTHRADLQRSVDEVEAIPPPTKTRLEWQSVQVKQEEIVLDDDIVEVKAAQEVIDLTLSDSDAGGEDEDEDQDFGSVAVASTSIAAQASSSAGPGPDAYPTQTALLTPIATVLKSDRLGIGLKAKTHGPHRASVKRVTHNAAALAAHVKAAKELKRQQELLGRGRRGFQRKERMERERHERLMAYLNR